MPLLMEVNELDVLLMTQLLRLHELSEQSKQATIRALSTHAPFSCDALLLHGFRFDMVILCSALSRSFWPFRPAAPMKPLRDTPIPRPSLCFSQLTDLISTRQQLCSWVTLAASVETGLATAFSQIKRRPTHGLMQAQSRQHAAPAPHLLQKASISKRSPR